ncbi:hypothetical protein GCK72_022126 [Caenorhabditis remanei]|uniref:Uncharacterized protein n=1 Tax=Caenorhabditis remanei TaxID=31234 RepID=A0A6A5FT35_CAERE|nr:hypothetical protein GCK72_022126 [Caenorhabditis remanei]KAF1745679.1 hypothetical protein GCK72_022126 [Caenorhabditis remanei]
MLRSAELRMISLHDGIIPYERPPRTKYFFLNKFETKVLHAKKELIKGKIFQLENQDGNDALVQHKLELYRTYLTQIRKVFRMQKKLEETWQNRMKVVAAYLNILAGERKLIRAIAPPPPPLTKFQKLVSRVRNVIRSIFPNRRLRPSDNTQNI